MPPLKEIFLFLIDPWLFMLQSVTHLPSTILSLLLTLQLSTLLSPSRFQSAWFGRFWATAGPGVRETGEARVIPLLEGRVHDGKVLSSATASASSSSPSTNGSANPRGSQGLSGVVLEVGPGTGMWASVFATPSIEGAITRIYGVEPNIGVHAELRQRVAAAGLGGTYEVVPLGIEDLAASGRVQRESVDCIVSILCLCSIPEPDRMIKELYGYLKPGGRWLVYEHVRCESERMRESGLGMRVYQGEYSSSPSTPVYVVLRSRVVSRLCVVCLAIFTPSRAREPGTKRIAVQPSSTSFGHISWAAASSAATRPRRSWRQVPGRRSTWRSPKGSLGTIHSRTSSVL